MLRTGQTYEYLNPTGKLNYAFGFSRVAIVADLDHNGYTDVVTFPSTFTLAVGLGPIVWLNQGGVFTPKTDFIARGSYTQFVRDTVQGDFNGDGYLDWVLVDQGWELNDRDPNYFFGSEPVMLVGGAEGLTWNPASNWLTRTDGGKTFNHIGSSADLDADGDLDLAIAAFGQGGLRVYENDGNGHFSTMSVEQEFRADADGGSYSPSGVTFINVRGQTKIAVGAYRWFDENDHQGPPIILSLQGGIWKHEQTLIRPAADSLGRNYGATDMYNQDINGDGREDLIIVWETENRGGIDDGLSDMTNNPRGDRYSSIGLSDNVASYYLQTESGGFELQANFNNLSGKANAVRLNWLDFNGDGFLDYYFNGTLFNPNDINESILLNDGNGVFSPIGKILSETTFPDWYDASTLIFDANSDGIPDMLTLRGVFATDNSGHVGEELSVYLYDPSFT